MGAEETISYPSPDIWGVPARMSVDLFSIHTPIEFVISPPNIKALPKSILSAAVSDSERILPLFMQKLASAE